MWRFDSHLGNTAAIDEQGYISYGQLSDEGDALATAIGSRCLVFVLCRNAIGSLLGYTGCLNHRIVPLLLDDGLDKGLLGNLLETYQPAYLWLADDLAAKHDFPCVYTAQDFSLLKTSFAQFPLHDDLALLLTTSGSTGSPKLVRQSYDNIRANTESIVEYLRLDAAERPITTMPMSYTYGLSIINSHLWVGATVIVTQKTLMQREFWQQFKEQGATSFGGVPYIYEMLDKLRFFRMDLPTLRTMTQAGGRLSPELHKKFAEYAVANGKNFVVMYGQTEATARMAYLPPEKSLEKYGSMGIAIPGGEFNLVDAEGNEITETDIVGELVYKGANVALGYAESGADLSKGDEFGGVLTTGDMAKRDADGYYYIAGRKKRFLKIYGNRVNLDETERLLVAEFPDFDCACGGTDDKLMVYISGGRPDGKAIKFLAEKTGLNPTAFTEVLVDIIPRNEAGKVLYAELETHL